MTSTPVSNDVMSVMLNVASQSVQKERTDNNFSDVLQKQSQSQNTEEPVAEKGQVASRTKVEKSSEGKIKEDTRVNAEGTKVEQPEAETLEAAQDEALEKAEELAGQLLVQIADGLGMSVEEVQMLMGELGMEPVDLLNAENLMQILLAAGGETDSLSLLTNEKLYAVFQELNKTLEEGLAEIQQQTGLGREEIMQLLEQATMTENVPGAEVEMADMAENDTEVKTVTNGKPEELEVNGAKEQTMTVQEKGQSENAKNNENAFANNAQGTFAQNLLNQQNVTNVTSAIPTEGYFSAETEMIMNQIMDFMKMNVGDGISQLEMQLRPENLGTLQIHVASKDGVITAHFTTENEVVKEALESQMIQLKDTFREQGIRVEAIEVSVQTKGFERNLEQGRQNQPGESNDSKPQMKVRRLNLRELEEIPTEELDEEEKLASEMMAQNGNTVDYTV